MTSPSPPSESTGKSVPRGKRRFSRRCPVGSGYPRPDPQDTGEPASAARDRAKIKDMLPECCQFELDHRGAVVDYEQKSNCRGKCGE